MKKTFSAPLQKPDVANRFSPGLFVLAAVLALAGCDRWSESSPGSMPAAMDSGSASNGRSDVGTPSSGVEVRTLAAPDTRSGGGSGPAGVAPVPDTSGAPSSGSTGSGSSDVRPGETQGSAATCPSSASASQSGGTSGTGTATTINGWCAGQCNGKRQHHQRKL